MASSAASSATNKCILCDSPAKACVSCHSTYYCGQECQQTDWPLHKHLCKKIKAFSPRPSPSHKLGLLFPPPSTAPELIWVEHEQSRLQSDDEPFDNPVVKPFLGGPWKGTEVRFDRNFVVQNNYRYTKIDHTLVTYCRDTYEQDGSVPNRAIIDATKGKARHDWKGPVVVLSQTGTPQGPYPSGKDITLSDLRTIVDYFMIYGNPDYQYDPAQEDPAEQVKAQTKFHKLEADSKPRKGFRLNCGGDLVLLKEKYSDVAVQRDHPIYSQQPTSVTKVMGMPLLLYQYPPTKAWKSKRASHDNVSATFLNIDADANSSSFGWAPPKWQSHVGSVLVVRQDGKPINAKQGFAIAEFCQHYLQPKFEYAIGTKDANARATVVEDYICQAAFEKYLKRFKEEMMQAWDSDAHTWRDVVSPYDT